MTINQALERAYQALKPFSDHYEGERKTYRFLLNLILKYRQSGSIVDVGTGLGIMPLALKFLGFEACGIDKRITQNNKLQIYEYDMAKEQKDIPQLGLFDIVLSSSTIEHVKSPRIFLQNIKNLLKPGGLCIILTPNSAFLPKRIKCLFGFGSHFNEFKEFFDLGEEKFVGHWREYTLKELKQMCAWSSFKVVKTINSDGSSIRPRIIRDFYYLILRFISFFVPNSSRGNVIICRKET